MLLINKALYVMYYFTGIKQPSVCLKELETSEDHYLKIKKQCVLK